VAPIQVHERPENAFAQGVKRVSYVLMAFMFVMTPAVILISGFVQVHIARLFCFE